MATSSNATEAVKVEQQLRSDFVELQKADSGVDVNESSTAAMTDNYPLGASDGIGEDVVDYRGEDDGCSITPPRGPGCISCKKSDCDSFKADGGDVDEEYPCSHEKLKKVFNNMKIWLMGCDFAVLQIIQSQLDKLQRSGAASHLLLRRVQLLAACLSQCSIALLHGNSTHDALPVEVVCRLLYSTLISVRQGWTLFEGIVHLERLTEDRDYFNREVAAYGYAGVTLTTIGSLQVAATELINNGKAVLQQFSLLESFLLNHDDIRSWYYWHCVVMGDCCFQLKEYEDSMPWYEAALRVATFGFAYPETESHVNPESSMAGTQQNKWKTIAAGMHSHIGRMYHNIANYKEAAKHWYDSAELHDDGSRKEDALAEGDKSLTSLFYSGDAVNALDAVEQQLSQTSNSNSNSSMRRAELLAFKGRIEAFKGDFDNSILSSKEAKKEYEEKGCLKASMLVSINLYLMLAHSRKHDYWAALQVVEDFQDIIDNHHKDTMWWFLWNAHKAHIYVDIGDLETASNILDQIEVPEGRKWSNRCEVFVASVRAKLYLYQDHRDTEAAEDQYYLMQERMPDQPDAACASLANMRAMYLNIDNWNLQKLIEMYHLCQQRVVSLRNKAGEEIELARALLRQAVTLVKILAVNPKWNRPASDINELIDEAIQLVKTRDHRLLATLKFAKTVFVENYNPSTGEAEGHDAAYIFANLQLKLKDLDSAWMGMLELEMVEVFKFMQFHSLVSAKEGEPKIKALIWAERGRMRLFMHLTKHRRNSDLLKIEKAALDRAAGQVVAHTLKHQRPTADNSGHSKQLSDSDELWFDRDDVLAEKFLADAVAKCGPGALILGYTDWEKATHGLEVRYIIYAVFLDPEGRLVVKAEILSIEEYYEEYCKVIPQGEKEWIWGKTLKLLISKTREFIKKGNDDLAKKGLSMLYSLLISPVREYVAKCQRLILAVHDDLALLPFAALYNKPNRRFLVQEKVLSYIPSIRVLHYCLHRQSKFEQNMRNGLLGAPFIAGNPGEWLQRRMRALPSVTEEATLVAKMLGVEPYLGLDMNKNAVKDGLSKASIVLLATHGLVNNYYPDGALILQDSLASDATITSDEIASLPGGIQAGLVVLSACDTGKGKVTSEGLLGLGRSLLQGGAATAILSLWEVGDASNKVLVQGMFQQLVEKGKDIAESLQLSMLQMIKSNTRGETKYSINHWASLVVLGSPFLKHNSSTFTDVSLGKLSL